MNTYAPYIAIAVSLGVNIALVGYAWGNLRQVVFDLKECITELKSTVHEMFPRIGHLEQRIERMEAVCAERHKDKGK